jgi:hypothetical protein
VEFHIIGSQTADIAVAFSVMSFSHFAQQHLLSIGQVNKSRSTCYKRGVRGARTRQDKDNLRLALADRVSLLELRSACDAERKAWSSERECFVAQLRIASERESAARGELTSERVRHLAQMNLAKRELAKSRSAACFAEAELAESRDRERRLQARLTLTEDTRDWMEAARMSHMAPSSTIGRRAAKAQLIAV